MTKDSGNVSFTTTPGFCSDCGTILPILNDHGNVTCFACDRIWGSEAFGDMAMSCTIEFNDKRTYTKHKEKESAEDADGPIVERQCPQCDNNKMSYATLQLRSADEGQTVFYTCTKCKFKETENS
ncbi:DNA-directed RNA polymerase I subunit RPA12 [Venturia canescens]|uniref:DNA-directed RNA polymerase I subunit RPA12 n=1 Tax=Venturia canescens TaxID=32260 RepID=UPI001C9C140F|nr:DNA-directed RNA polymerase I subunit RPA12 [Venturia canescens]